MIKRIFYVFFSFISVSCGLQQKEEKLLGTDVRLYKATPVWEVAKAIELGDTGFVRSFFVKNPDLLEYKEERFGKTLLTWAVYSNHYPAVVVLADLGADPNNPTEYDGRTAFVIAADKLLTSDYLRVLLKAGGDVNYVVENKKSRRTATPLIAAAWCRLESVRLLVEAGADVNYKWDAGGAFKNNVLLSAFNGGKMEIIHYLIMKCGVKVDEPMYTTIDNDTMYIVDELRELTFDLDSEEYRLKMEVVDYVEKFGFDYRATTIPKRFYELYDREYLEKY